MTRLTALVLFPAFALLGTACRFGGPEGDAFSLVQPSREASDDDAGGDSNNAAALDPTIAQSASSATAADGGADGASCDRPNNVSGCDPVRGTLCTPGFTQCVVDPGSMMPSGHCVLSVGAQTTGCDENLLYSTCAPLFTCKAGVCRKYCDCDADCEAGSTCSEPSGQGAADVFKLCVGAGP